MFRHLSDAVPGGNVFGCVELVVVFVVAPIFLGFEVEHWHVHLRNLFLRSVQVFEIAIGQSNAFKPVNLTKGVRSHTLGKRHSERGRTYLLSDYEEILHLKK